MRNLKFSLGGFTSGNGDGAAGILFRDAAYITGANNFRSASQGADVTGDGTAANPWFANKFNVGTLPVTPADTVNDVAFSGSVTSFTLHYYSLTGRTPPVQNQDFQGLFLSSMSFNAAC
ncbi:MULTISPECIES: hypothetical protein [unclassified Pseudoclavibacter]|uniref:hypothetical protein n=1 Tax=unclassified Pseudoclavibacter TaxID=2615177 RepID=UPI001BA8BB06|nr:hypothetical protein [Pseudoclavibacter sp. Marseille-Q4354]MBS3180120.1 hypothetical protein [Pseudoclavibacter sp. Marseille-Q4354]